MADSEKSGGDGQEMLYQIIGLIVVLFIVGTALANYGFDLFGLSQEDSDQQNQQGSQDSIQLENFSLSAAFPEGDISLGNDVINKTDLNVYRAPDQQLLGLQSKREVGKPIEGPVVREGEVWWRIDYASAPDGWVEEPNLTDYVWTYRALNIFPILFGSLKPFLILLSIILFIAIVVVYIKMGRLYELKQKKFEFEKNKTVKDKIAEEATEEDFSAPEADLDSLPDSLPTDESVPKTQDVHNKRWAKVESLINSHNVNDWKQAIIEADIILDEMLERIGYKGESLGEKLKQVEESDFLTLNQAWEAHKIRNRIAHKGSNYTLSRNDAERAFNLFKEVFEEFYFI